jgi:hypothetical protein
MGIIRPTLLPRHVIFIAAPFFLPAKWVAAAGRKSLYFPDPFCQTESERSLPVKSEKE